jgi:hypothetical protein
MFDFNIESTVVLRYYNQDGNVVAIQSTENSQEEASEVCWRDFNKTGYLSDAVIDVEVVS